MAIVCHRTGLAFKSPFRVQVVFLWRSREGSRKKYHRLKTQCDALRKQVAQTKRELLQLRQQCNALQTELDATRRQAASALPAAVPFDDPPIGSHGFGARMIAVALRLVQNGIGLRAAERALRIIFEALHIEGKVPVWTTIRMWLLRLGLGVLQEPTEKADDWVWLMDHSVQIGPEKVLAVLGIRAANLPKAGQALGHHDVRPIALLPDTHWKQADVRTALASVIKERGVPRAMLTDHGVDLHGGIEQLRPHHPTMIELYDFKHKAACRLKALLEKDAPFQEFNQRLGQTRCAIQQTELGFLTPPAPKPKARFMNLGPCLRWAQKMLRLLDHPRLKAQQWISRQRLQDKLGWLRAFVEPLAQWSSCQEVIDAGVKFVNEQGLFRGAAKQLRAALPADVPHPASRRLADELVAFVAAEEAKLKKGERLPLSTEIVESSFAKYKNLEGQHSKQGFTSLLLAYAALLTKITIQRIREIFATTSVRDVRNWIRAHLGQTHASKRLIAYQDFQPSQSATNSLQAA